MVELVENEIDWYIVFADGGRWHIWDIFTSPGYRHCFAIRWDGFNWVLIEPFGSWLEVQVMPYGPKDNVPQLMVSLGHKVMYIRKSRQNKFIMRGILTCVTIMKHLLGIRAWWILTPKQLAKYLERKYNGIYETESTRKVGSTKGTRSKS